MVIAEGKNGKLGGNGRTKIGGGSTFLGTAPTIEHCMLRDWSSSLPVWRSGDYIDH